ncbi:MAG: pyruvate dehydrogenase complex dihydrolipoamide acetyltransferase, partial [Alphaproteobacteria bacterium]|nr:pyruvate dehydrogenase complex dihydrolipoamide acetyltransferase [Alphaproteobacteria bacterium]
VAVNTVIAVLLAEGEDKKALASYAAGAKAAPAAARPTASAAPPVAPASDGRVKASPLAKRMAAQAGVELGALKGSGPHGRIVKADIDAAVGKGGAPAVSGAARGPAPAPQSGAGAIRIPHTNMRKVIARRLTEAKQTIPHIYLTIDCEIDELLKLRKQLNAKAEAAKADYKLSVNDFVIRAAALALRKVPGANVSWTDDAVLQHNAVDISVAVAIPGGLITPIIKNADHKGLAAISREMKDLATRAKDGKLKPEEFQGGTFSISNLGMYGIRQFEAVINPPQAAILAVGAGEERPVVKQGALAIATVMSVTLSSDHRVVDGALAAEWLQAFKGYVSDPLTMLL